ncbi:NAD-dependent epimerase/dehydratase family protein [Microbulbifer taiwanensis]|uniref:NAD-dependent epimerase/dehydratase family protein n=1 Tax=Microbulbifer taiwanensis TaxID=986746 RepID=UPI0036126908
MAKKALVVGATGLIGRTLVDQLAAADHIREVVTISRRPAPHSSTKVRNDVVDFERLDEFASLFDGDLLFPVSVPQGTAQVPWKPSAGWMSITSYAPRNWPPTRAWATTCWFPPAAPMSKAAAPT